MAANPATGRLYLAARENDEVICLDLPSGGVVWRRRLGRRADSLALAPNGDRAYITFRGARGWEVVNTASGVNVLSVAAIDGEEVPAPGAGRTGKHSLWMNPAGTRIYLSIPGQPYVYVIETANNHLLAKIGPFSTAVDKFVTDNRERYVFALIHDVPGFEVAEIVQQPWGGRMTGRVQMMSPTAKRAGKAPVADDDAAQTPQPRAIALNPYQGDVWIADSTRGYVYVFDISSMPPHRSVTIPLFKDPKDQPHPSWIGFGIDGRYLYTDVGAVIDTRTRKLSAWISPGESVVEVDSAR
jgi:DNA-binding beta-propeller fold protein YncE